MRITITIPKDYPTTKRSALFDELNDLWEAHPEIDFHTEVEGLLDPLVSLDTDDSEERAT